MNHRLLTLYSLLLAAILGCTERKPDPVNGPPPLRIIFRKSQIPLKGMVMGIQNTSNADVEEITVTVSSPDEEGSRSHVVSARIIPKDSITVGWVELDGWKLKPGDEVTVECNGYQASMNVTIPEP